MKTLSNTSIEQARVAVPDIKVTGNGNLWRVLCKASSEKEGWMKSTKAMEISPYGGVLVQCTTQQRNPDGSYAIAETVTFVPEASIVDDINGGAKLVPVEQVINQAFTEGA